MPSVRDKCRTTVHEFRRADSIPERLTLFRRVWAWIVEASRNTVAVCGILFIPVYLIVVGAVNLGACDGAGEHADLALWLIITGVFVFICALYFPFYAYGRSKARNARNSARLHSQQVREEAVPDEEIVRHIPCRMHRVANYAFLVLCGVLPTLGLNTYRIWPQRDTCPAVVYWTAAVLTAIWAVWLTASLAACTLCCCVMMVVPTCMKCCRRRGGGKEQEDQVV